MQIEKEQAFTKQYISNVLVKSSKITNKKKNENLFSLLATAADVGEFVRKMENILDQLNVTVTGTELKILEIDRRRHPIAGKYFSI